MGETQANAIVWKNSAAGLQESDADGEKVAVEAVRQQAVVGNLKKTRKNALSL